MRKFPDDPANRFVEYYGRYLVAKRQAESEMIWLSAIVCRAELRKWRSAEEAQYCENIFKGFMSQKQARQTYCDLGNDSRS
jgi:hypothetical protein